MGEEFLDDYEIEFKANKQSRNRTVSVFILGLIVGALAITLVDFEESWVAKKLGLNIEQVEQLPITPKVASPNKAPVKPDSALVAEKEENQIDRVAKSNLGTPPVEKATTPNPEAVVNEKSTTTPVKNEEVDKNNKELADNLPKEKLPKLPNESVGKESLDGQANKPQDPKKPSSELPAKAEPTSKTEPPKDSDQSKKDIVLQGQVEKSPEKKLPSTDDSSPTIKTEAIDKKEPVAAKMYTVHVLTTFSFDEAIKLKRELAAKRFKASIVDEASSKVMHAVDFGSYRSVRELSSDYKRINATGTLKGKVTYLAGGKQLTIRLGEFETATKASKLVNKASEKGFTTVTRMVQSSSKKYQIYIGKFASALEAKAMTAKLDDANIKYLRIKRIK